MANRFASQSQSSVVNLKRQLQNLHQGSKNCTKYLQSSKSWADKLAAVGKPIEDDELITFIVSGLNPIYTSFITSFSFATRDKSLSFKDFHDELLNHEMLLNQ
jgi:hypothetical protein